MAGALKEVGDIVAAGMTERNQAQGRGQGQGPDAPVLDAPPPASSDATTVTPPPPAPG